MTAYRYPTRPLEPIVKPVHDPKYLAWIREQPCIVVRFHERTTIAEDIECGPIQAAHGGADTGKATGRKGSDHAAVPLCRWHHLDGPYPQALDGAKQEDWELCHKLDLVAIRKDLRERYANR